MFHSSLNGLTPAELAVKIQESGTGFSIAEDAIYYQGRPIELSSGKTRLAEENEPEGSSEARRDLCKWLTSLLAVTKKKLIAPQAGAVHPSAVEPKEVLITQAEETHPVITSDEREDMQHVPDRQMKIAEAIEYIGTDYHRIDDLSKPGAFTPNEKYQILQTLQQYNDTPLHGFDRGVLEDIEPADTFNLIKDSLQFPYPDAASEGFSEPLFLRAFGSSPGQKGLLDKDLGLMRQLIGNVRRDMADVLNRVVDEIREYFEVRTTSYEVPTHLQSGDYPVFPQLEDRYFHRINHVLYLIGACCYFSYADDISCHMSYLTNALALSEETDLKWVARDLLFHLRNPGAVNDFSRYFETVANILSREDSVNDKYRLLTQLTEIVQIRLKQSSDRHTSFLKALEGFVSSHYPQHSALLLSAFNKSVERGLAVGEQAIGSAAKENQQTLAQQGLNQSVVHLLLLASASLSAQQPVDSGLAPFLQVTLDSEMAFFSLFNGWRSLIQSSTETQRLFAQSAREDDYLLSALMGLPQLHHSQLITDSTLAAACHNLLESFAALTPMSSPTVLELWLVTLNKLGSWQSQTGVNLEQAILKLTGNMSQLEKKLRFVDVLMDTSPDKINYPGIQSVLKLLGFGDCPKEETVARAIEDAVSDFAENPNPVCQWLWAQRKPFILALYLQKMVAEPDFKCFNEVSVDQQRALKEELIELIHEFAQTSATKTFITTRHCTTNNPHLAAVYQQRPDLAEGWSTNFSGFSDSVQSHLSNGDSLELSEDPWDLFICSEEVNDVKTPRRKKALYPSALMSNAMDGSYALIAQKDPQGVILRKALIRLVITNSMNSPALLVEAVTPWSDSDQEVFVAAASELARQMNLPLFTDEGEVDEDLLEDFYEKLEALEGRAPFDHFGAGYIHSRSRVNFSGNAVSLQ